jgi:Uma2 family endonuclease
MAAMSTTMRLLTAGDLWRLPDDGNRYELVRGVLVCMSPESLESSRTSARVAARIGDFVDEHDLGAWGDAQGGFKLAANPDVVRAPDAWFVRAERVPPQGFPNGYWHGCPDLAVEVLSPSDRPDTIAARVQDYLDAGTRLVWVYDPGTRAAAVFGPDRLPSFVLEDGGLDGEDILPGFRLPLRDLLPRRWRRA